ncbi:hypothetical protein FIBSPDRAFT_970159 [Athelia psychrophila]|uniref:Uncharacterized protein n=1 Tax=Athelia psychrophila TaxID=1759441 RepID=A0A167SW80_9AGAM|nr:hypothetical protein FIBSPDRAFT_970159 [Fibularhizoctonia sp. CBS 109695]
MSDPSLSVLESHAKTGTDLSTAANSGAAASAAANSGAAASAAANSGAADMNSDNQGEGEGEGPKGDSIEGNGGEGDGRGNNDIGSGEKPTGPQDDIPAPAPVPQDDIPAPAPGPVMRKRTQMICEVLIERKTTPPAQKPKAAPQKKPRFTVTTCQMAMKCEEGGGICDKDLDPDTEVGRYKRCKMHREIEAQRQRAVRYLKSTAGGGKRKREGGQELRGSKKRSKVQKRTNSESASASDLDDSEGEEENARLEVVFAENDDTIAVIVKKPGSGPGVRARGKKITFRGVTVAQTTV